MFSSEILNAYTASTTFDTSWKAVALTKKILKLH